MFSFIQREAVIPDLRATSKKQLLQELSSSAASIWELDERSVFDALLERERLGATSVGDGVAIPHARLPEIESVVGLFARLVKPIDFDAADEAPVDLIFMLLAPVTANADHLKALAKISRMMKKSDFRAKLRGADGGEALFSMLTEPQARAA